MILKYSSSKRDLRMRTELLYNKTFLNSEIWKSPWKNSDYFSSWLGWVYKEFSYRLSHDYHFDTDCLPRETSLRLEETAEIQARYRTHWFPLTRLLEGYRRLLAFLCTPERDVWVRGRAKSKGQIGLAHLCVRSFPWSPAAHHQLLASTLRKTKRLGRRLL